MFHAPSTDPSRAATRPSDPDPSPAWHARATWLRYARHLLRYYTRSGRYRLCVGASEGAPLAWVDPVRHVVGLAAGLPEAPEALRNGPTQGAPVSPRARRTARLLRRPTELWLRGLISHEAAHVRFSGEKPAAVLGWLWNALEDERAERLMAAAYPDLAAVYDALGDVMLARRAGERGRPAAAGAPAAVPFATRALGACLWWRWLHDQPGRSGADLARSADLGEDELARLRPLIEAAWGAPTSEGVVEVAREILRRLGIPPGQDVPEGLPDASELACGVAGGGPASDAGGEDGGGRGTLPRPGGGGPSGEAPAAPEVDPASGEALRAEDLLEGLHGGAARLARALRAEAPRTAPVAHRSRGRYAYRRHVRGEERLFDLRPSAPRPPAYLTCLLDVSGSMVGRGRPGGASPFEHAARAALLLSRAAELAGTACRVIPFRETPLAAIESAGGGHEALRIATAALRPRGSTALAPALEHALERPPSARGAHVVLVVSDGELDPSDADAAKRAFEHARKAAAGPGGHLAVLPILVGEAASAADAYARVFARACALEDPARLPDVAERWLRHAL